MYLFELVDVNGDKVADGLTNCVKFMHAHVHENMVLPKSERKTFEYTLYILDGENNEVASFVEDYAKSFLFSVRDTIQLCGGKL